MMPSQYMQHPCLTVVPLSYLYLLDVALIDVEDFVWRVQISKRVADALLCLGSHLNCTLAFCDCFLSTGTLDVCELKQKFRAFFSLLLRAHSLRHCRILSSVLQLSCRASPCQRALKYSSTAYDIYFEVVANAYPFGRGMQRDVNFNTCQPVQVIRVLVE